MASPSAVLCPYRPLPGYREKMVNRICEALRKHLPISGEDGLQELKKIAARSEEKMHTNSASQSDYLRKNYLKMMSFESNSENPLALRQRIYSATTDNSID